MLRHTRRPAQGIGAVLVFVFVILGAIMRMCGFSIVRLLKHLREGLAVVFATTSSDSVLPQIRPSSSGCAST